MDRTSTWRCSLPKIRSAMWPPQAGAAGALNSFSPPPQFKNRVPGIASVCYLVEMLILERRGWTCKVMEPPWRKANSPKAFNLGIRLKTYWANCNYSRTRTAVRSPSLQTFGSLCKPVVIPWVPEPPDACADILGALAEETPPLMSQGLSYMVC